MAKSLSFAETIQKLEDIVKNLESEQLDLETALSQFEKGIALTKQSQELLKKAEQKVQMLIAENGSEKLVDYDKKTDSSDT